MKVTGGDCQEMLKLLPLGVNLADPGMVTGGVACYTKQKWSRGRGLLHRKQRSGHRGHGPLHRKSHRGVAFFIENRNVLGPHYIENRENS